MRFRSALIRYVVAAAIFAVLLLLPFVSQSTIGISFDTTFLIILAMVGCAWYLGRGPGLLVALLFETALIYFSTPAFTTKAAIITLNRLLLFTGVVFFASARKKAERNLRDQSELFRVTLSSIGDAVIATDVEGRIRFLNPTAESLTGWKLEEIRAEPLESVFKIVNEETREPLQSLLDALRKGSVVGLANSTVLIARDGSELPIDDSGAPIKDANGNVIGAVIVFHDVSEKRRADREREKLLTSERAARLEAESANRTKDEFLATVSHELRTPLNAILGWAAMLRKKPGDVDAVKNGLGIIERNAKSQNEIIGDILDVSRIVSGKLTVDLRPMSLSPVIKSAVDSLRPVAVEKGVALDLDMAGDDKLISGDPERLQQVFWNIISNAIKFTPSNGRVTIKVSYEADQAEVHISDTGDGISPEFLTRVFDRFHQVDSSMKRSHGGLGLGLAIVHHIVEQHYGTVTASSKGPGLGSTFTVALPFVEPVEMKPELNGNEAPQRVDLGVLNGLKVLVVDDNTDSAEICCMALEQHGSKARTAFSVEEAVRIFDEWQPDLLISDLGMPFKDGFDLIAQIRSLPGSGGTIPAAALTAYARESDRDRVLAEGFDLHIPKPIEGERLAEMIAELMSNVGVRDHASAL